MYNKEKNFQPLVSIVCPTYNEKDFLKPALKSLLNQTYSNIEIVIVDSSTDDRVKNIVEKYKSRIRYYWREKRGIADALNYGIEQARGEFVARMDADDISMEERIEKQVAYLLVHENVMMLGTQAIEIDAENRVIRQSDVPLNNDSIRAKLIFENSFYHPSVMFRRKIFDDEMRYDINFIAEDYDLWTRLALKYSLANLSEKLICYRRYDENASIRLRHKVSESTSRSAIRYIETLFGLDLANYDIDDVCRVKTEFEHHHNLAEYIVRQIDLMYEIWNANSEKKLLDKISLSMVLNKRWQWDLDLLGGAENISKYRSINFDIPAVKSDSEELFLYVLSRKYNCELKDISTNIRNDLEVLVQDYQNFLREKKNIAVYGLGRRGRRFLEQLHEKRENGECNWNLAVVSDKKIKQIEFENVFYHTTDLLELGCVEADYIVITPLEYRQIETELSDHGIEMGKVFSANMLI